MARNYSDTAPATTLVGTGSGVASGLTNSDTTMELGATLSAFLTPPFALRLEPGTANEEMVVVKSGAGTSGSPYAILRAQGTTTAKAHSTGVAVSHGIYSADFLTGFQGQTGNTSVANTTSETTLCSFVIPANEILLAGATFSLEACGNFTITSTPTLQLRAKVSSAAGTASFADFTALTTSANGRWRIDGIINVQAVGTSASCGGSALLHSTGITNGNAILAGGDAAFTVDTTSAITVSITAQWSAASVSNSIACRAKLGERIF